MLIKGDNSGRNEFSHNYGELRDAVCLNTERILMNITLRHNQDIRVQTTFERYIVRTCNS